MMKRRYVVYGKESAQMTDSESNETLLTHWEGLIDVPEQVWRWVATPGYLVAETPWQVLRIEPSGWDDFFARLLNQELGVPSGWTLEWEPGACVVSRIAHVGTGFGCFVIGWICVSLVHRLFEWSTGARVLDCISRWRPCLSLDSTCDRRAMAIGL